MASFPETWWVANTRLAERSQKHGYIQPPQQVQLGFRSLAHRRDRDRLGAQLHRPSPGEAGGVRTLWRLPVATGAARPEPAYPLTSAEPAPGRWPLHSRRPGAFAVRSRA